MSETVLCPHCSRPTQKGRFCEACGKRLPPEPPCPEMGSADSGSAAISANGGASGVDPRAALESLLASVSGNRPSAGPFSDDVTMLGVSVPPPFRQHARVSAPALPPLPGVPNLPSVPQLLPGLSALPSIEPIPSSFSAPVPANPAMRTDSAQQSVTEELEEPGPFAMECSMPYRLVEGMGAALIFRLRSSGRDMEEVSLSIREGGRVLAGPVVHSGILGPRGAEVSLNLRPGQSGSVAVCVRAECSRRGSLEKEVWTAPLTLLVEPASDGTAAPAPLTINVNNEGDLAEIKLGSLVGGLPRGRTAEDRLRTVANPREFHSVSGLSLASSPTRVSLVHGSRKLHLIARIPAWFGRQGERPEKGRTRDNAAVLCCFAEDGNTLDEPLSLRISRSHFLVESDGPRCRLRDGAPARDASGNILPGGPKTPSGCGTAVNGARLRERGSCSLSAGDSCEISLAPDARPGGVLTLRLDVIPDAEEPQTAAGALLRRTDSVPEDYLVLWGEADLGAADGKLSGFRVLWDGARFTLRSPNGGETTFAAGTRFGTDAFPVRVETFKQIGV